LGLLCDNLVDFLNFVEVGCSISIKHQNIFASRVNRASLDSGAFALILQLFESANKNVGFGLALRKLFSHLKNVIPSFVFAAVVDKYDFNSIRE
jgi:hypothetical protein